MFIKYPYETKSMQNKEIEQHENGINFTLLFATFYLLKVQSAFYCVHCNIYLIIHDHVTSSQII